MKKRHFLLIVFIFFVSCVGSAAYYFIFTNRGSIFILKSALSRYAHPESIDIKQSEGSLAKTTVLHNLEINNLEILPKGSTVRIQKLEFSLVSLGLGGLRLGIQNGRLILPGSELIIFSGGIQNNVLDFNIYSRYASTKEISKLFSDAKDLKKISGSIGDIDIFVKGSLTEPEFQGEFKIEKFIRDGFSLSKCPLFFNLQLKDYRRQPQLFGQITANAGVVSGRKTAVINLSGSKISFSGDPEKALLDLRGTSDVEGTKINIVLKGTLQKPDLKLTSEPSLPEERLLLMLATDKSWKASELAMGKTGGVTVGLAQDFIDYFVFSGSGSKIARYLGVSDLSVTFEKQKKGVGIKKAVTEKMDASYAVEQTQQEESQPATKQKVGGEYKITESVTVGAEKELKKNNGETGGTEKDAPADDKVFLKFKKEF